MDDIKAADSPVFKMDDQALQIHAMVVAYRDAEQRCAEAESRMQELLVENDALNAQLKELTKAYQELMNKHSSLQVSSRDQKETLSSENRELDAHLKDMTVAYQELMKKLSAMKSSKKDQTEELRAENKELNAQLKEMAGVYQTLMAKHTSLRKEFRKLRDKEEGSLKHARQEKGEDNPEKPEKKEKKDDSKKKQNASAQGKEKKRE
ncbi:MAG: hypothetical protein IK099_09815 [Clostridia bacterium]|nr:hypothetical protein [Clostridia bacterium]